MITSIQNSKIKHTRDLLSAKKHRDASGQMVIEGVRLAEEALNCGINIHLCLFSTSLSDRGQAIVDQLARNSIAIEEVSPDLMKRISDTQTPQGILLITDIPALALPEQPDALIILDMVRNPGNMGTILRTAAALGMDGVILTPGTADPFAPKVLRSAMGAQFHLPVIWRDVQEIQKFCSGENKLHIFTAASEGTLPCWEAKVHVKKSRTIKSAYRSKTTRNR